MNDKNFIEELRQKREEYGVTQRKLAVACGICFLSLLFVPHLRRLAVLIQPQMHFPYRQVLLLPKYS